MELVGSELLGLHTSSFFLLRWIFWCNFGAFRRNLTNFDSSEVRRVDDLASVELKLGGVAKGYWGSIEVTIVCALID